MSKTTRRMLIFLTILVLIAITVLACLSELVYVSKNGQCYHTFTCPYLQGAKMTTSFRAAKGSRYLPCEKCNPRTDETIYASFFDNQYTPLIITLMIVFAGLLLYLISSKKTPEVQREIATNDKTASDKSAAVTKNPYSSISDLPSLYKSAYRRSKNILSKSPIPIGAWVDVDLASSLFVLFCSVGNLSENETDAIIDYVEQLFGGLMDFSDRAGFYADIAESQNAEGLCILTDSLKKYRNNPITCIGIALCDCIHSPALRSDYRNGALTLYDIQVNYNFQLEVVIQLLKEFSYASEQLIVISDEE